ncbi:MAG: FtsX-like permease family protein, partial [ANME-2 cluster archaeon]|nr:FtsX-like permease family protein [ANME-2 cluster archaeon]
PLGINKMITIDGRAFRIVGILDSQSNNIIMPIQMAYQMLDEKEKDTYDSIVVKIKDEDNLDTVVEKIENKLMIARHVTDKNKDFTISTNKQMTEVKSEMMSSMNTFLTAIAAVSLLVGAVGISNTMFTSVLEKTKEIGIMKAIGARNRDILAIFLFNAGLIGLAGGILGVVGGIVLSGALPSLLGGLPMARGGTYVSLNIILIALSVSFSVGLIAGFIPAYQGSKLKPVDALRYE